MSDEPYQDDDQYDDEDVYIPDQMAGADHETGDFSDPRYGSVSTMSRPSIHYVNESGLPQEVIERHRGKLDREVASIIEKWSQSLSGSGQQSTLDVFNRNRWSGAQHQFAQFSQCAWAVENDDILSTTCDVLEGLMWQKCRFELFDEDQQDVWNQWAGEVDLDTRLRQFGREIFKVSQFYCGVWWERRVYSVRDDDIQGVIDDFQEQRDQKELDERRKHREEFIAMFPDAPAPPEIPDADIGPGKGNRKRKKKFAVEVPTAFTIFDPTKIMPVGTMMFGRERFAYIATREEDQAFGEIMKGERADGTVLQLIEGKYKPNGEDKVACAEVGVDHENLWLFREDAIFRHTLTKAEYERFSPVRLKPALALLEMKQHLRAADRATLIGQTNFIVVITKGTDRLPAKAAEIANLQEQARLIARMPVLVGDHRLKVEIVAPGTDNTLIEARHQVLDSRLVFMALRSYSPVVQGGNSSGVGVSEMSRVIAKGLESRRHMVVRSLERWIFQKVLDKNEGMLDEFPSLAFTPKRITLDFKADVIQQILKIRDRGDMSRETMLEEMDYDQDVEVLRRARESALYDGVFQSGVPHSSPLQNPFQAPQQPPPPDPQQPGGNVGDKGQPRTEGGRPAGVTEDKPRKPTTKT